MVLRLIDLEFQPTLNRISVPRVSNQTTVEEAIVKFSEQVNSQHGLPAGTVKTSIKQAIPYRPVFTSGQHVPLAAPQNMPLSDLFCQEGGLFVVDLEDDALKVLTPDRLKPKKKKKKKKRTTVTEHQDSELEDESAMNPGLIDGSATSAITTDFDDMSVADNVQGTDLVELMLMEMKRAIEVERREMRLLQKEMVENSNRLAEKTSKLEKEMAEKTSKLEKEMAEKTSRLEREVAVEQKKTSRLEREMEEERIKSSRLELAIRDERKKRSMLALDVGELQQSTQDIASWIVAGCLPKNGGEPLRRIQLRNLLDRVQARLAWHIRLTDDPYSREGSVHWREEFKDLTLPERLKLGQTLLQAATRDSRNVPDRLTPFMSSVEAMQLAVESRSQFRFNGDQVAHHDLTKPQFITIVDEHCRLKGDYGDGLKAFVHFLFP